MFYACSHYRLNDIGFLEESIFATVPEGEVASAMCYQQIVVERVEGGSRQSLLKCLRNKFIIHNLLVKMNP